MMKTLEEYEVFARALRALCEQHGIGIVGTCEYEMIYGEITLVDMADPATCGWKDAELYVADGSVLYDNHRRIFELDYQARKKWRGNEKTEGSE